MQYDIPTPDKVIPKSFEESTEFLTGKLGPKLGERGSLMEQEYLMRTEKLLHEESRLGDLASRVFESYFRVFDVVLYLQLRWTRNTCKIN